MAKTFEELKEKVEEFNAIRSALSSYGATDTEPRWAMTSFMRATLEGDNERIKDYLGRENFWQIFSSKPRWKGARLILNNGIKKLIKEINNAPYPAVRRLAEYYGWDR